jgi:NitT/TauT family transport system substrate-binding protein
MSTYRSALALVVALGLMLAIPVGAPTVVAAQAGQPKDKVRMQLSWVPQAQFAGFLVAKEKGYYDAENLDVDILPGGPDITPIQALATGGADFTVDGIASLYAARDKGIPAISVAQIDQKSGFALVAYKTSGITQPEQFKGRKVGVWYGGNEYEFLALMAKVGINPDTDLTVVKQPFTMDPFLNHELDVASATLWNEYNVLLEQGLTPDDLNVIHYDDYGTAIPRGTLITTESMVKDHNDLVQRFVRATLKGWQDAFTNQPAAIDATMKYVLQGTEQSSRRHQELMLQQMAQLDLPAGFDPARLGYQDQQVYAQVADIAQQFNLVQNPVDVNASYTPEFWQAATGP